VLWFGTLFGNISPPQKNTGLTHIQIFLLEDCEAVNGDRMTYACGIWHESRKCLGRQMVQILSRNFGMLKNYKYKLSVVANF
jgi:hypothetical protein